MLSVVWNRLIIKINLCQIRKLDIKREKVCVVCPYLLFNVFWKNKVHNLMYQNRRAFWRTLYIWIIITYTFPDFPNYFTLWTIKDTFDKTMHKPHVVLKFRYPWYPVGLIRLPLHVCLVWFRKTPPWCSDVSQWTQHCCH